MKEDKKPIDFSNLLKNKKNKSSFIDILFYAVPVVLILSVILIIIINAFIPEKEAAPVTDELYNAYANENTFKDRVYGESQTPNMENVPTPENEELPISVYGDSYCISADVQTPSFPAYLSKYTNSRLVYNVASPSDTLEMVGARTGGIPMYISPCDIPRNKKNVEITLENEYGTNIVPDLSKNAGLNPCKVNGVEGVISIKKDKLYFTRSESGFENIIAQPTIVNTRAMDLRLNDITVFFVGSDDIYSNPAKTVEYYTKIIESLNTDKYLIIGPVYGNSNAIKNTNAALEEAFGNKFYNLFDYLCDNAAEDYALILSGRDMALAENKTAIPEIFLAKDTKYFNDMTNNIIGEQIAEKLKELNYISKISN